MSPVAHRRRRITFPSRHWQRSCGFLQTPNPLPPSAAVMLCLPSRKPHVVSLVGRIFPGAPGCRLQPPGPPRLRTTPCLLCFFPYCLVERRNPIIRASSRCRPGMARPARFLTGLPWLACFSREKQTWGRSQEGSHIVNYMYLREYSFAMQPARSEEAKERHEMLYRLVRHKPPGSLTRSA